MEDPKQQIVERLKQASNVLVTVSTNPSVDQLSAAIGFTLLLNKLGKHGTAVFSGEIPAVLEFLKPEQTIEKNTDSLRDFIIALDKSKADKLRYKVEDSHVKIFITPYRTSISEKDLEFSQGDFNVDVVMTLGVRDPKDLDQAITSHGRILHDATVIAVSTDASTNLGSLNWADASASSLCEMLVGLGDSLGANLLDEQMATAYLTGVVAETDRFSNAKTTAVTMSTSSKLLAAGANQQLVATQLQEPESTADPAMLPPAEPEPATEPAAGPIEQPEESEPAAVSTQAALDQAAQETAQAEPAAETPTNEEAPPAEDGTLQVSHHETATEDSEQAPEETADDEPKEVELEKIHIDEQGTLHKEDEIVKPEAPASEAPDAATGTPDSSKLILDPPTLGGTLTANAQLAADEPTTDALSMPTASDKPLLNHDSQVAQTPAPALELPEPVLAALESAEPEAPAVATSDETQIVAAPPAETARVEQSLADLEKSVQRQTVTDQPVIAESDARDAVQGALSSPGAPVRLEPTASLNAQPLDLDLGHIDPALVPEPPAAEPMVISGVEPVAPPPEPNLTLPPSLVPLDPTTPLDPTGPTVINPSAPPPVPPPMPIMPPMPDLNNIQPPSADPSQQPPQPY